MNLSMSTSGSAAAFSLPASSDSNQSSDGSREDDLRRALRHHARALKALRGSAYETLSEATRSTLIEKLERDWAELKCRLREHRNKKESVVEAPTESSDAGSNDSGWMQRLASGLPS